MPSPKPPHTYIPVHIPTAKTQAPLSAQQKKFNRSIERITKLREELSQWVLAANSYREQRSRDIVPLEQELFGLQMQVLELLDKASDDKKIKKAERQKLAEVITDWAGFMLPCPYARPVESVLKEIYNRYSGSDYDEDLAADMRVAQEMTQDMMRDMFGVDMDAKDIDFDNPDEVMQKLHAQVLEQMQAAQEAQEAQQQQAAPKRPRKPTARERKLQEETAQATQSIREIYRKLASLLHPDRETDPAERERKTALMQRVNQAYQDNKLLDLLQLQLEVEQIDAEHIASLSEERLKHYNRVLAEQVKELDNEVLMAQNRCIMEHGLDEFGTNKPSQVLSQLRASKQQLSQDILALGTQTARMRQSIDSLRDWLRVEHHHMQTRNKMVDPFDSFDAPGW